MRFALSLAALGLLAATPVAAQPAYGRVEETRTNAPAYFFFSVPGEATIRVAVWGTVRAPGLYDVRDGTTLDQVLSLAGGPVLEPQREDEEVTITVRVFRGGGEAREVAYQAALADFVAQPGRYPALADGDVVEVATRQRRLGSWRDALPVVASVAGLATVILQVINLTR